MDPVPYEEMTNLILNSGVTVFVISYFIFRDYKYMGQLQQTLTSLINTVETLKEIIKAQKGE